MGFVNRVDRVAPLERPTLQVNTVKTRDLLDMPVWSARRLNRLGAPNFSSAYLAVLNVIRA